MNIPLLLITFNRPEKVRIILNLIRGQRPTEIYIAQDGPRFGNTADIINIQEVRKAIVDFIDWPCKIHTQFQEKNLGCGKGPIAAISWFFINVESGIILEDDCLPHPDFFPYCELLLEKYKNDSRISFIGGSNYGYQVQGRASYSFSSGHHQTWGWATWRRTWKNFEYELAKYPMWKIMSYTNRYYHDIRQRLYWTDIFAAVKKDQMNNSCWDYQFYFSCWRKKMVAICPSVNLVSNIGDGYDATHTQAGPLLNRAASGIMPLSHPKEVELNIDVDNHLMINYIIPASYGKPLGVVIIYWLNKKIKGLVGHKGPWIKKRKW